MMKARPATFLSQLLLGLAGMFLIAFLSILFVPEAIAQDRNDADLPDGYIVYQSLTLGAEQSGIRGLLQILQDKRVTPAYRQTWGASADPELALGESDPLVKDIKAHPLQNGRLRFLDEAGQVLVDQTLGVPLGEIRQEFLYANVVPTYFLTVDEGNGVGSYTGLRTVLFEIKNGSIYYVHAKNGSTEKEEMLVLGQSLKSDWRIVAASNKKGKEIRQVQCRPRFDNNKRSESNGFTVSYTTYRSQNGHWYRLAREANGFWESDSEWPSRSAFR